MLAPSKKRRHFLFRVDGDSRTGLGHLVRCGVLMELLLSRNHSVTLVGRLGFITPRLVELGLKVVQLNSDSNGLEKIKEISRWEWIDWLVVDNYDIDIRWEVAVSEHAARVLVIDDLANRRHHCDALVDQNIMNPLQAQYKSLIPENAKLLMGMDFLLARPAFYNSTTQEGDGILIFLGGGDHTEDLVELLRSLNGRIKDTPILVMATANYRVNSDILIGLPHGSELHIDIEDPYGLMMRARCGIVRCGFAVYELALLGRPMVMIASTSVQREVAFALTERSFGVVLDERKLGDKGALDEALESVSLQKPTPLSSYLTSGAMRLTAFLEEEGR